MPILWEPLILVIFCVHENSVFSPVRKLSLFLVKKLSRKSEYNTKELLFAEKYIITFLVIEKIESRPDCLSFAYQWWTVLTSCKSSSSLYFSFQINSWFVFKFLMHYTFSSKASTCFKQKISKFEKVYK